ncbi:MAG: hypothetical protein QM723_40640 [Myxococcaceae bacterium]
MADVKQYPVSIKVRAVDALTGPLGEMSAKLKAFSSPFEKLEKGLGAFGKATGIPRLADAFGGAAGAVKNVGSEAVGLGLRIAALGATGIFAFGRVVQGAVASGDELSKMADRVGMGIDAFASLRYAAAQADVEQEQFNGAMDKLSKNMGEAKANGGSLLGFLQKVSPALAEQFKGAKTAEQGLSLLTDAFVKLKDPQKRAALATEAFGRDGAQMGEFLKQGQQAIDAQRVAWTKLHGSSEQFGRGASDLDNQVKDLGEAFDGLRSAALGPLLPVFGKLVDQVIGFSIENRGRLAKWADDTSKSIQRWVDGGGIDRLADSLGRFSDKISEAWNFIGGFKGAAIGLGVYLGGPLIASIAGLVPAFAELGVALLTTPFGWVTLAAGGLALAGVAIYKDWQPVKGFFEEFFPNLTKEIGDSVQGVKMLSTAIQKLIDLKNELKSDIDAAGGWKKDFADATGGLGFKPLSLVGVGSAVDFQAPARQAAQISVVFKGAPPGTRVTTEESTNMSIDTSVGYSSYSHK